MFVRILEKFLRKFWVNYEQNIGNLSAKCTKILCKTFVNFRVKFRRHYEDVILEATVHISRKSANEHDEQEFVGCG